MPTAENTKPDKSGYIIQPIMDKINEVKAIEYATLKKAMPYFAVVLMVIYLIKLFKYFKKRM